MQDIYDILKEKNIILPKPPAKGGIYTSVQELVSDSGFLWN